MSTPDVRSDVLSDVRSWGCPLMAFLLAVAPYVLTLVAVVVVTAWVVKTAVTVAHDAKAATRQFWSWATRPWPKTTAVGVRHGWEAAHGRQPQPTPRVVPAPRSSVTHAAPPAPPARPVSQPVPAVAPVTIVDPPAPERVVPTRRGERAGYHVGRRIGVAGATTATFVRSGRQGAREAWVRGTRPPEPEVEPDVPVGGADPGAPVDPAPAPTPETPAPGNIPPPSADPGAGPQSTPTVMPDPPAPKEEDPPPPVTPAVTPTEPTATGALPWMRGTTVVYQIPGEIPDHHTLIDVMERVQAELGAGDDLNAEIAALDDLLRDASILHERMTRDFGQETTGEVGAFEEAAASAKAAVESLLAALTAMAEATEAVKKEATTAVGA